MPTSKDRTESDALAALRQSYVFGVAPDDALLPLARLAKREHFEHETIVCRAGASLESIRYIEAGTIRASRVTETGVVVSLPPMMRGGWATWPGAFCDPPVPHDLVASPGTDCLAFPVRAIREISKAHPEIYPRVLEHVSAILRGLMTLILSTGADDQERALARAVLAGCRAESPVGDGPVTIEMTQEQIGRLGFGSRQRVAKLLRALENAGVLTARYGQVNVPSLKALEAFLGE